MLSTISIVANIISNAAKSRKPTNAGIAFSSDSGTDTLMDSRCTFSSRGEYRVLMSLATIEARRCSSSSYQASKMRRQGSYDRSEALLHYRSVNRAGSIRPLCRRRRGAWALVRSTNLSTAHGFLRALGDTSRPRLETSVLIGFWLIQDLHDLDRDRTPIKTGITNGLPSRQSNESCAGRS